MNALFAQVQAYEDRVKGGGAGPSSSAAVEVEVVTPPAKRGPPTNRAAAPVNRGRRGRKAMPYAGANARKRIKTSDISAEEGGPSTSSVDALMNSDDGIGEAAASPAGAGSAIEDGLAAPVAPTSVGLEDGSVETAEKVCDVIASMLRYMLDSVD